MSYENPWIYNNQIFNSSDIDNNVAFVYKITNLINGKSYIGKKTFVTTNRIKVKNKTNRKIVRKESDWKKYYGSSDILKEDVLKLGNNNFKREIIKLCTKKSLASYHEAREQFLSDCLMSDNYYNNWISVRITKKHLL